MQLPDEIVDDVRKRLRRAAGQVQAVERMLAEGEECRDVVTQLSAATKALEQAGFKLIAAGLTYWWKRVRGWRLKTRWIRRSSRIRSKITWSTSAAARQAIRGKVS